MKHTEETKKKISDSKKGTPAWNKGTKQEFPEPKACKLCKQLFYKNKHMTPSRWLAREFCSCRCSNIKPTVPPKTCETCQKLFYKDKHTTFNQWPNRKFCSSKCALSKAHKIRKGMKLSKEWCENLSKAHMGQKAWNKGIPYDAIRGSKNHNWKGGCVDRHSEREYHMGTLEYKNWRKSVFDRDDYTCQHCNEKGGKLNADHIKPYSLYPELRLDIDNGRTLCVECHRLIGYNFFRENNPKKKDKK